MEELKKAQKYIFIETFIISEGYLLDQLFEILKQKGEEGIEIKIIYDDLGSKRNLRSKTIKEITKIPNCKIVNYNPLGLNINPAFNYRNHRKISIIDGKIAYCGGDNLADEYIHKIERFG
jgi:cardiolipin synthase